MKKLLSIIYDIFLSKLISYGLFNTANITINNKKISFHDIGNNSLLENIAINGYKNHADLHTFNYTNQTSNR